MAPFDEREHVVENKTAKSENSGAKREGIFFAGLLGEYYAKSGMAVPIMRTQGKKLMLMNETWNRNPVRHPLKHERASYLLR